MMTYSFDHVKLSPHKQIGRHSQSEFELTYIITGFGERTLGTVKEPFSEGEVILVPPEIPHEWRFREDSVDGQGCIENISFIFPASLPERISELFPEMADGMMRILNLSEAVRYDGENKQRLIGTLREIESRQGADRASAILSLMEKMACLNAAVPVSSPRPAGNPEKRMEQIRIYTRCNMARDITLKDIAAHIGMNRTSFCSFFKKMTGQTFVAWLNTLRTDEAVRLLEEHPEMSVSEIADALGFGSLSHFSRVFSKHKMLPPSKWRD